MRSEADPHISLLKPPSGWLLLLLPLLLLLGLAACWAVGGAVGGAAPGSSARGAAAAAPPPPGFLFAPAVLDLGGLASGEVRTVRAAWRRTGHGPLAVPGVLTSCGCLAAEDLPRTVPEGAVGSLAVEVRAPRRPGPFTATLDAIGRAPGGDRTRARWTVRGWVAREVAVVPARIDLGRLTVGRGWERRVRIRMAAEASVGEPAAHLEGLEGRVSLEPPVVRGAPGWSAHLTGTAPREPGPFAGTLTIALGAEGGTWSSGCPGRPSP